MKLGEVSEQNYVKVSDGSQLFFVVKKNILYKLAQFIMRKHKANKTVDAFVTDLFAIAEHYKYGRLHDELIRERIVVGLADTRLSERMEMEKRRRPVKSH